MALCTYKLTPGAAQAIPYYATLTQSWFYADHGDTTLIFQIGRMSAVSWSISTEWLFYLAYPICIGVLPRPRNPWGIGLASIAVAAVGIAAVAAIALAAPGVERAATDWYGPVATRGGERFYLWLIGYSPYPRLAQFLLGCLAASLYLRLRDRPVSQREQRLGWWTTIAAVGATLVLYLLYYVATAVLAGTQTILSTPVDLDKFPRWILILFSLGGGAGLAPVIAIAVFGVARYRNPIVSWLSAPTLLLCGEASYSLYLLHPAMLGAFANTIGPVTSFGIGVANLLALGLAMASAIGLSLVSWRCLEVPARRWLRRILTVRLPPKPELAA